MNKGIKGFVAIAGLMIAGKLIKKVVNMPPPKYSIPWIRGLSDDEWAREREIVRQKSCDSSLSLGAITEWENLRNLFDKIKSEKDWAGRTPAAPSYPREHGHNLYKPD